MCVCRNNASALACGNLGSHTHVTALALGAWVPFALLAVLYGGRLLSLLHCVNQFVQLVEDVLYCFGMFVGHVNGVESLDKGAVADIEEQKVTIDIQIMADLHLVL